MAILRSPGCGCCTTCEVVEYQDIDHSLVAGTPYQLPGNINSFNQINLSNLLPQGFFKTKDDWFDVSVYRDVGGTPTIQGTIRYQLMSLGHSYDYHHDDSTIPYPTVRKFRGLGASVDDEWYLIKPDSYNVNVGCKEVIIADVSDGTFDGNPCVVSSLKDQYSYYYGDPKTTQSWLVGEDRPYHGQKWNLFCRGEKVPNSFALEKNNYVLFDNETSFNTTLYRFNNTSEEVTRSVTCLGSTTSHTIAVGQQTSSVTRSFSGTAGTISTTSEYNGSADIESCSSASATGAGHFKLECTRAYTTESGSVDIRIYRTGGNSEAVDVTVYVDGTPQTVSFTSGQNYADITVTGQAHDGLRDSLDLHDDSTPPTPKDAYTLAPITVRANSWELHGSEGDWLSQKHATAQTRYFYYNETIPFDRSGSVWDGTTYIKVDASKDVDLGYYELSKIRNDATCDYNDEHEKGCPLYEKCSYTSEHNHQPADFEDSSGTNALYLPTAEKHVFVSGCSTYHLFRDEGMAYEEPAWVYKENLRIDQYLCQSDPINPCVYLIENYTPPTNTSSGPFTTTCGDVTVSYNLVNDYSNLPSGYVYLGSTEVVGALECVGYTGGSEINIYYADYDNETPASASNLSATGFESCSEWSYAYGDSTYTYTTDSSSPLNEVLVTVISDVVEQSDFSEPSDTSDTSYEFVHTNGVYAGVVFQWNGTDYDMIGQERIHRGDWSILNTSAPQNPDMIARITEPLWFWNNGSYYYIEPHGGGNLTWEGPFSTPVDSTASPAIEVQYAGRKRVRLSIAAAGVKSDWIEDAENGTLASNLSIQSGYFYQSDTGTSTLTTGLYQWKNYITECGNTFDSVPDGYIEMRGTDMFPYWGNSFEDGFNPLTNHYTRLGPGYNGLFRFQFGFYDQNCACIFASWTEENTETDVNELMDPPSDAESCPWSSCLPTLAPLEKQFSKRTGPNTNPYDSLPSATSEVIQITVGSSLGTTSICDCVDGTTNSGQVTQYYLDFSAETVWDGTLVNTGVGSTNGFVQMFTTDPLKGELRPYGYDYIQFNQDYGSPDFAKFTKYTSCWSDDAHPTLVFTESDCDVQSTDSNRSWRFVSGYELTTPTLEGHTGTTSAIWNEGLTVSSEDGFIPVIGEDVYPCYNLHRWQGNKQHFVDIHPRYLNMTVKAFTTSWPK